MERELEYKIKEKNPWYIADQVACASSKAQQSVIQNRIKFILKTVKDYKHIVDKRYKLKILDAGCGDGVMLKVLTQVENAQVYGIDYNSLRLNRAKQNAPLSIITKDDIKSLCFNDNFFDIVLINQVLEHIKNDISALKELNRVLNSSGILILGVPNEGCFFAQIRNNVLEPSISMTTDHINFYTEKIIKKSLERTGFIVKNIMREGFFMPHQTMSSYLTSRKWGYRFLTNLGKIFKSSVAGLYFVCVKKIIRNEK